jgi:hypothetical protein
VTQTRNIYITGNAELDRILADLAARLDVLEGLRPDLSSGFIQIDADKELSTSDPMEGYQQLVDGVTIEANSIEVEDGEVELDNTTLKLGAASSIKLYDPNGTLIHKME